MPASPAITTSSDVSDYRIYQSASGGQERLLNFAPLASDTTSFVVTGLSNAQAYGFRVVCADVQGRESVGIQVQATPDARYVAKVSFTLGGAGWATESSNSAALTPASRWSLP